MTMASEATKNLQGNRTRPRSIVPAIPLPYVQKRKLAVAPSKEGNEITSNAALESNTSTSNTPMTVEVCHSTDTNGTSGEGPEPKNGTVDSVAPQLTSDIEVNQAVDLLDSNLQTSHLEEQTGHDSTTSGYETLGKQRITSLNSLPHE